MQKLEILLRRYAEDRVARSWIGDRPNVPDHEMWKAIAGRVGYPTSSGEYLSEGLYRLSAQQAAYALAAAGTTSLAYGPAPSDLEVELAAEALGSLDEDASFLSNGVWSRGSLGGWNPLTTATFDCGLIAYDGTRAFIYWVEEED